MEKTVEQRKRSWVDFYDLSSPVNRLLVVDYRQGMPQRPLLW